MNCSFWCDFTTKSEPILSKMAEPCRLSPNACAGKPALAPPEKPFALFFEIPPRRISFFVEKGVFWWFVCHTWQRRWGFAQAAKPPRSAPSTRNLSDLFCQSIKNQKRPNPKNKTANAVLCLVNYVHINNIRENHQLRANL